MSYDVCKHLYFLPSTNCRWLLHSVCNRCDIDVLCLFFHSMAIDIVIICTVVKDYYRHQKIFAKHLSLEYDYYCLSVSRESNNDTQHRAFDQAGDPISFDTLCNCHFFCWIISLCTFCVIPYCTFSCIVYVSVQLFHPLLWIVRMVFFSL